jgi:hypothetical protein
MTCKTCGEPIAQLGVGESTTLVGFSSPPGHNHDDNCVKRVYSCANGHRVVLSRRRRCPVCDWVGNAECFCHDGPKVDEWPDVPTVATHRYGPR